MLFSIVALLLISIVSGVGYYYTADGNKGMDVMYTENLLTVHLLNDSRAQARAIQGDLYYIVLNIADKNRQNVRLKDIEDREKTFLENWDTYKNSNQLDSYEEERIAIVESSREKSIKGRAEIISLAIEGKQKEALEIAIAAEESEEQFQVALRELAKDLQW